MTFFLTFTFLPVSFITFFALIFGLNMTNAALTATGEGMTGYITKKKRLLEKLKKKRLLGVNPFAENMEELEKRMTDNEDAAEIGSFITMLGVIQNLVKYFGSATVGHIDWEWVCLITAIISPLPLLIYTIFLFKEEKVSKMLAFFSNSELIYILF